MSGDALAGVRDWLRRDEHLVVGLMTGTSADGVDAALVRFHGHGLDTTHEMIAYREWPLGDALRDDVLEVAGADAVAPERLLELDAALGETYAEAVRALLGDAGVAAEAVGAIGSHGQTVRHVPRHRGQGRARTLQIGSAAILAERTGITVVSDFRTRDAAAGGEGAPLVPLVDWWLFRSPEESRVLLNLGGMANVTWLPRAAALEDVIAFDTGPGNVVLDGLAQLATAGARRDEGGARAAKGIANPALLRELLEDPYFSLAPPRSTGREHFGAGYALRLRELGRQLKVEDDDLLATAVELTATSVADALARWIQPRARVDAVYASGGGVRNPTLMKALEHRLSDLPVRPLDALGTVADGKEALAFAFLAHQTLCGVAGNVLGATGAARRVVLGHITPGGAS